MKTAILLCLLTGCSFTLTGAKVDGLDTYIVKKNRIEQMEIAAKKWEIQDAPEWLVWSGKSREAQDELKQALAGKDDECIVQKSAKLNGINEAINELRIRAIITITQNKKGLPIFDKAARDKGFANNNEFVKARQLVAEKLVELSNATKYQDTANLDKTFTDFLDTLSNLTNLSYKLEQEAKTITPSPDKK